MTKARRGFTLIELLVVIAIITILMSILLPVLRKTRSTVGVGLCAANLRTLGQSLHSYVNDNMESLPHAWSSANLETYETINVYKRWPSGLGALYAGDYLWDPEVLFCPQAEVCWGSIERRQEHIEDWALLFRQNQATRSDYVLGWWGQPDMEDYKRNRVAWSADAHDVTWWRPHGYHPMSHQRWKYMNVATVDGAVRCIIDWIERRPRGAYYWPHNDRPGWTWWSLFGSGEGL